MWVITGVPGETETAVFCPTILYRLGGDLNPTIDWSQRLRDLTDFDVLDEIMRTRNYEKKYDWGEIWNTVREVTPEQWEDVKRRLRDSHVSLLATIDSFENWSGPFDIGGVMSIIAHTAYHLGGIRQALAVIRSAEASSQTSATAR